MIKVSSREKQVLQLISQEYRAREIASMLYISKDTVDSHRKNLYSKLQVRNMAGLIRKGFETGLLKIQPNRYV